MTVSRTEAVGALALAVLLAVAIVRVATPDRARLRPLSVEGIDLAEGVQEGAWTAPADVYVVGWSLAGEGRLYLLAPPGETRLAMGTGSGFYPGSGYRVERGAQVRLRHVGSGPASALVYFVTVEGN